MPLLLIPALLVVFAVVTLSQLAAHRKLTREVDENGRVQVDDLHDETGIGTDGAVRSVQSGTVWLRSADLDQLWTPTTLERLARTYWYRFGRLSGNTLRVVYGPDSRSVALFGLIP